ncbi:hypothetical protein VDG1235_3108 [Verrucomicrobiia bacterium DG1235]|nr:hypothetical protein VDG1235_3108 [Verrucomicrobiae bacterium DG1235]
MILEAAIPHLTKKAIDATLSKTQNNSITQDDRKIEEAIAGHIKEMTNWCSEISFKDLKQPKPISGFYIPLDFYIFPQSRRVSGEEKIEKLSISEIFNQSKRHSILLGQPGAGKTTSIKNLCNQILKNDKFECYDLSFPLVIRLRELNNDNSTQSIVEHIASTLHFKIQAASNESERKENRSKIANFIEELKIILILDGFDELSSKPKREDYIEEIRFLARTLSSSLLLLTSRTGDFTYNIENANTYELCSLTDQQVSEFAHKWITPKKAALNFLEEIKNSPFHDTAIRPLTIAHLCAIYERIGRIPQKPKTVYKKVIQLLLEEWDEQRSVSRLSRYGAFESDRKFDFLSKIAFELSAKHSTPIFYTDSLKAIYKNCYEDFDLPKSESTKVITEIESHNGLILRTGFERYEFAHKSLQEYLAAEYIVRLSEIPTIKKIIERIPNELAVAVSISSDPSHYLTELVLSRFQSFKPTKEYLSIFISRLLLERPDFNRNEAVQIAFSALYSQYWESNIHSENDKQILLFQSDYLKNQFSDFSKHIFKRNSLKLKNYYSHSHSITTALETKYDVYKKHTHSVTSHKSFVIPQTLTLDPEIIPKF